ncbi:predicted protein [Aspergillus lentulus]|nr:predicted protein [Aspergillus lentulus]
MGDVDVDGNSLQEEEEGDPRTLAGPALSAEEFKVNIPPVRCELNKRAGAPAVVRLVGATHWYRIISFQGLAAILKSKTVDSDIDIDQFMSSGKFTSPGLNHRFARSPSNAQTGNGLCTAIGSLGALYGTTKHSGPASYLQEMAFTMGIFQSRLGAAGGFCMDDPVKGFVNDVPDPGFLETSWPEGRYDGHMIPVALILQALRDAADSWEQVANHLSSLVDDQGAIFDPDEHDRLLFDDNTFSRSRLYFWPIDRLGMFIPSISATMREWQNFWEARKHIFNAGENFIREVRRETGDAAIPWCAPLDYLANLVPQVEGPNRLLRGVKILSRKYALPD